MTDIGLGLIDRRTVVIVLFTMVLAQVLFGLPMPIDTTNLGAAFIDLVILTGYLYISRSAYRFPFALILSGTLLDNVDWYSFGFGLHSSFKMPEQPDDKHKSKLFIKKLLRVMLWPVIFLGNAIIYLAKILIIVFSFETWVSDYRHPSPKYRGSRTIRQIFAILDRVGLFLIALLTTMPGLHSFVRTTGIVGLIIMMVIFAARGDFTALVKDSIK